MAFSVPPSRVPTRSPAPVIALLAVAALILGAGVTGKGGLLARPPATPHAPAFGVSQTQDATARPFAGSSAPAPVPVRPFPAASPAPFEGTSHAPAGTDRALPAVMPVVRSCDGGDEAWCRQLVRAALLAVLHAGFADADVGTIRYATVWHSLVCDVPLDCPTIRLMNSTPLGSVILSFVGGGPRAWINVVRPHGPGLPAARTSLDAWIARWG